MSSKRLGKLAVGCISEGCTVPEIVTLFKFLSVHSAKEGNDKTTGLETCSVFQSVATWFEYLYSPEQCLLGYHIRKEVRVCRKESFLIPRQGRSMEWIVFGDGAGYRKQFVCSYCKSCGNVYLWSYIHTYNIHNEVFLFEIFGRRRRYLVSFAACFIFEYAEPSVIQVPRCQSFRYPAVSHSGTPPSVIQVPRCQSYR